GFTPHPARYPSVLPEFFIKLLTDEGDIVVDPFAGSNVTGAVCEKLNRNWISVELDWEFVRSSAFRFKAQILQAHHEIPTPVTPPQSLRPKRKKAPALA